VRSVVLLVRFLLELAVLAAVAAWGWQASSSGVVGAVLAAGTVGVVACVWGLWVAPRAGRRLPDPARLAVETVVFAAGGAAAWAAWGIGAGAALFVASVVVALLTRHVGEPVPNGAE
jgi:hypothetical protein